MARSAGGELVVGTFSPSVLLGVARRTGALGGLTVREEPVASSPAQFRSLLSGELDAVLTSPDNVVAYRFVPANPLGRTADVRIVLGVDRGLGLAVYARPGITSPAGLRGATLGVDVTGSGFAFALYELLAAAGLRRGQDYRLVELGATPRRLDALLAGGCDATLLNAGSDLRAEDAGLRRLARVVDVVRPYLGTVLAVAGPPGPRVGSLARGLRETAAAVVADVAGGGGKVCDLAVEEAAETLRLPAPLARRYVQRLADPDEGVVADGAVDAASLRNVVDLRRRHGEREHGDSATDPLAGALDPVQGLVDATDGGTP